MNRFKGNTERQTHFEEWHLFTKSQIPKNIPILQHIIPGSPSLEFCLKMDVCVFLSRPFWKGLFYMFERWGTRASCAS